MAKPRVYAEAGSEAGVYHVISRCAGREMLLGDEEKRVFREMLVSAAGFHKVKILTMCLMGNHFHLLVRVPRRPEGFAPSVEEVLELWEPTVCPRGAAVQRRKLLAMTEQGRAAEVEDWRASAVRRMFSISEFTKSLKQRFSQWYNRTHDRTGVLWESRFRSVIVQDKEGIVMTVGAYIDLNPVRAGLVKDPGDYLWCGYGEAMNGELGAQMGIVLMAGEVSDPLRPIEGSGDGRMRVLDRYRSIMGITGRTRRLADGTLVRRGLDEDTLSRLEGAVDVELLLRRVRQMSEGVVLGGGQFVDEWFERHRWWFGGRSRVHRTTGARRIGGRGEWTGIFCLRNLKKQPRGG
jgi:putative transposase